MTEIEKAVIRAIQAGGEEQAALEAIITRAAKRAAAETRKQDTLTALHNTQLLMDNYRALKGYEDRAIASADAARSAGATVQGEAWLRSIRKNKARTATMLAHVDAALEELNGECTRTGRAVMFEAYRLHYLDGLTLDEISDRLNAGKNTPGRWCKKLNERLAVLLFGVDGLRRW